MKKVFFGLLLAVTGCATPTPLPELEEIQFPELETITIAELGDTMVRHVIAAKRPSWRLTKNFEPPSWMLQGVYPLRAGTVLTPFGSDPDYESFSDSMLCRNRNTGQWCVGQNAFGDCNEFTCSLGKVDISATRADWIDPSTSNIDQRLIYNGRLGSSVKFTYREFDSSGYARDAFTQDVQYDLDKGTTIGFKGARIEVIHATNQQIFYRVLQHFAPL